MAKTTDEEVLAYHAGIQKLWKKAESKGELAAWMRHMCQTDIYFLGYYVIGRTDLYEVDGMKRPWLFERCMEVQKDPDWHLDVWARDHYKDLGDLTPVLTTSGWKTQGTLEIGDHVYTPKGTSEVVAVRHFTDSHCRKVVFNGNTSIVCGNGHLWKVQKWNSGRIGESGSKGEKRIGWEEKICETSELMSSYRHPFIECNGYDYPDRPDLPIPPYTLGAWLGDGSSADGRITGIDEGIFDRIRKDGFSLETKNCNGKTARIGTIKGIRPILRLIGVLGNKHIPPVYFNASREQRLELLRGLMDTDGCVSKSRGNGCTFVQKSHELARDVLALACSIGYRATMCKGKNAYYIYFPLNDCDDIPFSLERKMNLVSTQNHHAPGRYIRSVEEFETVPTTCIQIADPDGMYLCGHELIPTHNSTIITYLKTIQDILIDPEITICIYSYNIKTAKKFLMQIRDTLQSCRKLIELFPDILFDSVTAKFWTDQGGMRHSMVWGSDMITVKRKGNPKEATVECSGLVVGQKTGGHYNLLVYDDVEVPESVSTNAQMLKTLKQFEMSLNTGSSGNLRCRMLGTFYMLKDVYYKILNPDNGGGKGNFKLRKYSCYGEDGKPVLYTEAFIDRKRKQSTQGVFEAQMLCDPSENSIWRFDREWIPPRIPIETRYEYNCYILCDPAGNPTKTSDYTTMWVCLTSCEKQYYFPELVRDKMDLDTKWKTLKELVKKYTTHMKPTVFYEKVSMQDDIGYFLKMQELDRSWFTIIPVSGRPKLKFDGTVAGKGKKEQRIQALVPLLKQHMLHFSPSCVRENWQGQSEDMMNSFFESEYDLYPFSDNDDALDSLCRIADLETGVMISFPEKQKEKGREKRKINFIDTCDGYIPY